MISKPLDHRAGGAREKRREFSVVSWEWPVPGCCLCVCVCVCCVCVYVGRNLVLDGSYSVIGNDSGQSLSFLALSAWNQYLALTMNYCVSPHRWYKPLMTQGIVVWFLFIYQNPRSSGYEITITLAVQQVDSPCRCLTLIHPSLPTFSWRWNIIISSAIRDSTSWQSTSYNVGSSQPDKETKKKPSVTIGWLKCNILKADSFLAPSRGRGCAML